MQCNPDYLRVVTKDGIRLQGMHYQHQGKKDICVLMIHGMSGVYHDNYFGHVLGTSCVDAGYDYMYIHNRGWGIVNDLVTNKPKEDGGFQSTRGGAVYERFQDSKIDIQAWVDKALEIGYKRLVLVGHSFGGPKIINFYYQTQPNSVVGLVLASAADMIGLTKRDEGENYEARLEEAKQYIKEGKPDKILKHKLANWVKLSAQTYVDEGEDGAASDVLPILRNPDVFPELASINTPILAILSENDSVIIRSIQEDLKLLRQKATNCPSFSQATIKGTDHVYEGKESEFAAVIVNWLNKEFSVRTR